MLLRFPLFYMRLLITLIFTTLFIKSYCQTNEKNIGSISILAGMKTRITPIYLKHVPDVIHLGNIDILEQPGKHLAGPGLAISVRKKLGTKYSFSVQPVLRYDYIYQRLPLVFPEPASFDYKIKRKLLFDLYADVAKILPARNSSYRFSFGFALCSINSGYIETHRIYQSPANYTDFERKKNFIFPAVTVGLGWQKNKIYTELKFGYCWNDPTLYDTPFIFPEISLQYQIFSSHKKND